MSITYNLSFSHVPGQRIPTSAIYGVGSGAGAVTAPSPLRLCSQHQGGETGAGATITQRQGLRWTLRRLCPQLPRGLGAVVGLGLWQRRCSCCHQQRATFVGWCQGVKPSPDPRGRGAGGWSFSGLRGWSALRRKEPQEEPVQAWAHAPWLPQGPLLQPPWRRAGEVGRRGEVKDGVGEEQ